MADTASSSIVTSVTPRIASVAAARMSSVTSSSDSASVRNTVEREIKGEFTSKNGFSVVAPTRMTVPSSTPGRRASCCALLKRWISSRKRMVRPLPSPSRWSARARTSRTSLTPADVADMRSRVPCTSFATRFASVVLPVPGGPHRIIDDRRPDSTMDRNAAPSARRWLWPMTSSRVRGRIRCGSGASARLISSR